MTSKIGCCGFVPLINYIKFIFPIVVIQIGDDMSPVRDQKTGFCIESKRNEKGLLVGIIGNKAMSAYDGYSNNKKATESKIITNVFKKGKSYFIRC